MDSTTNTFRTLGRYEREEEVSCQNIKSVSYNLEHHQSPTRNIYVNYDPGYCSKNITGVLKGPTVFSH